MHSVLKSELPGWLQLLVYQQHLVLLVTLFGGMLLLMLIERPHVDEAGSERLPIAHWLTNIFLAALNYTAGLWLVLTLGNAAWLTGLRPDWSLLTWLHPALALPLLWAALEGIDYGMHRLYHAVPMLWRIHAVHHMDRHLDVTTSHRHHTLEVLVSSLIGLPLFIVVGAPPVLLVLLMILRTLLVLWNHARINLPPALERWLRYLLVTPAFHHVHHLDDERYTNSNFGTTVPWFDYLFNTAQSLSPKALAREQVGLDYLDRPGDDRLDKVLLLPLRWPRSAIDARHGTCRSTPKL